MMNRFAHSLTSKLWARSNAIRSLSSAKTNSKSPNFDPEEVAKFNSYAHLFWTDAFKPLRAMNAVRIPLVRDGLMSVAGVTSKPTPTPLKGYKIIDVGCGGGLLSEPLARLGAEVTGMDPAKDHIEVATEHASHDDEIKGRLHYVCDTVQNFSLTSKGMFDAVVCSEVVEHVPDVASFVQSCVSLCKDGGSLFFTTINRTALSYLIAILLVENILRIVPKGMHQWSMFVKPKELSGVLQSEGCRVISTEGLSFNPVTKNWSFCNTTSVGYAMHAVK